MFRFNIGMSSAVRHGMKEEMAFLKYRREVVQTWPESPRKAAVLTAIESRMVSIERLPRREPSAALPPVPQN